MPLSKLGLIAGLALATIIPSFLVDGLIDERAARQAGVQEEFTRAWGPRQQFRGPVLVLPYRQAPETARRYLQIAPAGLTITAAIAPQERRRGLFHATVYEAQIGVQANFSIPDESKLDALMANDNGQPIWDQAFIAIGATSLAGLRAEDAAMVAGTKAPWSNCRDVLPLERDCPTADVIVTGTNLNAAPGRSIVFEGSVDLRGTGSLKVQSAAKEIEATMQAPWPAPSFVGEMLPLASTITAQGFHARWQTTDYGAARTWMSASLIEICPPGPTFGVDLIEAMPTYQMIDRTAKYSLLLVVLSFATYFFFELLSRLRIHPVQYGLLGLSLSLFALLLLSLGEVIGYTPGFAASAGLVLLQSSIYTAAIAKRAVPAIVFATMLATLFGFLYVLLSLESYSLLVGAIALFAVLSVLMALTQRVRWIGPSAMARAKVGTTPSL